MWADGTRAYRRYVPFPAIYQKFPDVGFQQRFDLVTDLRRIAQRGFLHRGELCLVHIVHDTVYVGFQFGSVYHVQLIKLTEHHMIKF